MFSLHSDPPGLNWKYCSTFWCQKKANVFPFMEVHIFPIITSKFQLQIHYTSAVVSENVPNFWHNNFAFLLHFHFHNRHSHCHILMTADHVKWHHSFGMTRKWDQDFFQRFYLICVFYKAHALLLLPAAQESTKPSKTLIINKYYASDYFNVNRSVIECEIVIALCNLVWSRFIHIFRSFETCSCLILYCAACLFVSILPWCSAPFGLS